MGLPTVVFLFLFGRSGKFAGKLLIITESLVAIIYIGIYW